MADLEVLSSQVVSGALPHVKQIKFDSTNDVVTVELLYKGLDLPVTLSIICRGMTCKLAYADRPN